MKSRGISLSLLLVLAGCATSRQEGGTSSAVTDDHQVFERVADGARGESNPADTLVEAVESDEEPAVTQTGFESAVLDSDEPGDLDSTDVIDNSLDWEKSSSSQLNGPVVDPMTDGLLLDAVIASVYESYPLLEAALYSRNVANGEQLAAAGGFDLKLKAASENGPTGFYQTYRQSVGLVQPVYQGGEVFAGYRIGRGDFEPWYLERQTNGGGEFKAGLAMPLSRNRDIDARRAQLWRSSYGRQQVEPEIQAQLIGFVQEASYIYWDWVAAGEKFRIADRVLDLAENRTQRIRRQVEENFLDPPELTDNLRLVAERSGKRADAARKLQQTAVKLSLYYRDFDGHPLIPNPEVLPTFPDPMPIAISDVVGDMQLALQQRPEVDVLNLIQRRLEVDYAEAHNDLRPSIDAVVSGSQDTGLPTSSKNDKGEFELGASIFVDVPIQRRKARGKMQAVEGKIAQLHAKRRLTEDKIVAEVQSVYAGLMSAYEQVEQARQAVGYAEDLARRERRNFNEGASDLLKVTLREQYAAESAEKVVDALLLYFQAQADYRASLAQDRLP